ncbi:hypothetical protein [Pseudothioclava nitratireducens]|uniref:hypothetical protein n=1 Tax=Pseudothioclava nitratireducens TaxID=1928646 RepID=UPI0023DBD88F|nr:hypothetical protein [Defluviimonas nitratireducens]MDF1620563.1 hypothetical protein [Defluviimonas nitratireducens]
MAAKRAPFGGVALAASICLTPAFAEDAPMSAIDWLSNSVVTPAAIAPQPGGSRAILPPLPGEPPVSSGATVGDVSVISLDKPSANAIGLLPVSRTGLPRDLWGVTPETELAEALRRERFEMLPAMQGLLLKLALAELAPPAITAPGGRPVLFLARVDKLLELGALEPALALLEQADATDPEIFRRRFDVALLLGEENRACDALRDTPSIAPAYATRVFCLARGGDWDTAILTFGTGRAIGQIEPEMETVLERFLDPELDDGGDLPPPSRPSPLIFRMMEAIGQPMPTGPLPVAFAQADLRANTGWKARIEAAERLARSGAIDANQLLGLYTENEKAPSGRIWDRARAIATLDRAITASDRTMIAATLPEAYRLMEEEQLEMVLATLWGAQLAGLGMEGDAGEIAFRLGLLGESYESVARAHRVHDRDDALLIGIARGQTGPVEAQDQLGLMLKSVFDSVPDTVPAPYADRAGGELGLMLLAAIDDVTEGARGDYPRAANGLRMLRLAGLEDVARRAALELIILERRG